MYTSKLIDKWYDYKFQTNTVITLKFEQFARAYKSWVKQVTKDNFELVQFRTGHFCMSGFLKHITTGKYVYFSISDVRFFPNAAFKNILIRTAKGKFDYTGGANQYTEVYQFNSDCNNLIEHKTGGNNNEE